MDPSHLAASMLPFLLKQLASPAIKEIAKIWKVDKELGELLATCKRIQPILDKCDNSCRNVAALETWLEELEGYCYDTEDLVDLLSLTKGEKETTIRKQILKSSYSIKPLITPHKIVNLRDNLDRIIRWIEGVLTASMQQPHPEAPHCKSSLSDRTRFVYGTSRDNDKRSIIKELTSLECRSSGVSIVGVDGLGKTALARAILVDETIAAHFPLILCASVSNDFHMEDVVHKLVEYHLQTSPQATTSTNSRPEDSILKDLLCSQRALIILDDLWSVEDVDWERFKCNYLSSSHGSWKIMTTTRDPKVAEVTRSITHYLHRMSDDDCTKLIMDKAMLSGSACEVWGSDIEAIARRCKGMPIVANKLGLKLYNIQKEDERKDAIVQFKMKKLWELKEFEEVFPSLKLDVPKMPLDLRRCLAYCSLFPPTHQFNRVDLNQLWEVEGFIQPQLTRSSKQAVNHPFDDMLSRSILGPCESRDNKQQAYKMDEFNHEFAHFLSPKAFRRACEGTSNLLSSCERIRHLSLACYNIDKTLLENIGQCKGLRTFLLLHINEPRKRAIPGKLFEKLRTLRLLDLSHTNITDVSKSTLSKHLRYLDLSHTEVRELPSFCFLHALQILKLKGCSKLQQLPKDLSQLVSLTHLHVDMKNLKCKPSNIGMLTKLQVLNSFVVGANKGRKISELGDMKHLQEVQICGLENIRLGEEAREAMLSEKPWLRTLVLDWDSTERNSAVENGDAVLEALQPHDHLRSLEVRNYGGKKFPTWLGSPSCQLVSIFLDGCESCEVLPSLGQLPLLKNLALRYINKVESLDDQFYGQGERSVFPCLELLEFHYMEGLANWTGLKAGDMPCLRALRLGGCPRLVSLPSFQHLSCLMTFEINNCPKLLSLPELPSSKNGEFGELIIMDCALVKERCQVGGVDWSKIENIPYVEIDTARILTDSSNQPSMNDKDEVLVSEDWFPTFTKLLKGYTVTQFVLLVQSVPRLMYVFLLLLPWFLLVHVSLSK